MDDIKEYLKTIVEQLDKQEEDRLITKLNSDERDVKFEQIHTSLDCIYDKLSEIEYKLEKIELELTKNEKRLTSDEIN